MTNYGYNIRTSRGGARAIPASEYLDTSPGAPNSYPLFSGESGAYPMEHFSHSTTPVLPSPERTFSPAVAANHARQKQQAFKEAVFASLAPAGGSEGEAALAALHADPVYRQKLAALYHSTSAAYTGQSKNIQGNVEGMQNQYDNAPAGPEGDVQRGKLLPQIGAGIQNVADNFETIKNLEARGAQFVPGKDSSGNKVNPDLSFSNYPRAYPVSGQKPAFNPGTPQPAEGAPGSGVAIQNRRAQQTADAARTAQIESKLDTAGVGSGPVTLAEERAAKAAYPYDPALERTKLDREGKQKLEETRLQGAADQTHLKQRFAEGNQDRASAQKVFEIAQRHLQVLMRKDANGNPVGTPAEINDAKRFALDAKTELSGYTGNRTQGPPTPYNPTKTLDANRKQGYSDSSNPDAESLIQGARDAIQRGADRQQVIDRLQKMGVDATGL